MENILLINVLEKLFVELINSDGVSSSKDIVEFIFYNLMAAIKRASYMKDL